MRSKTSKPIPHSRTSPPQENPAKISKSRGSRHTHKTVQTRKQDCLTTTAYHEAGHALGYYVHSLPYDSLSVIANDDSLGRLSVSSGVILRQLEPHELDGLIIAGLAGMAAEAQYTGRTRWRQYGWSDYNEAFDAVAKFHDHLKLDEIDLHLRYLWERSKVLMRLPGHWAGVTAVAERLVSEGEISAASVHEIIKSQIVVPHCCFWRLEDSPATTEMGSCFAKLIRGKLRR